MGQSYNIISTKACKHSKKENRNKYVNVKYAKVKMYLERATDEAPGFYYTQQYYNNL